MFGSTDVSHSVSVPIVDDTLSERVERFTVILLATVNSVMVSTDSGQATVEIVDNDSEKNSNTSTYTCF